MLNTIIVGSGAAGVAAALRLAERGIKPLIVDVGFSRSNLEERVSQNLYDFRRQNDSFELTIGQNLQGFHNLAHPDRILPVKLTAPNFSYVTRQAEILSPTRTQGFSPVLSFAMGGLANAWGAGVYRYLNQDLAGFPLSEQDLAGYFDRLTEEMGVSGTADDLLPFFGDANGLQEPLRLSHNASRVYRAYQNKRASLNRNGFYIGRPRLAVLSRAYCGRQPCDYTNLEFWQPGLPHIYSPVVTLERLIRENRVVYQKQRLVDSFEEFAGGVSVHCRNMADQTGEVFQCTNLVLAAGAINSAKIVLASRRDFDTELPLLDNPALQIPLVLPASLGRRLDREAFGLVQLNLVREESTGGERLQGSIMEVTSPMRAEFFSSLPYCASANLDLIRYLLPAMMVMQLFFPSSVRPPAKMRLLRDYTLSIQGEDGPLALSLDKTFLKTMRLLGILSHPKLIVRVPNGHAIHYGGTLPMRQFPSTPYQCHSSGRLNLTKHVFVADGANFPTLPAKNSTFAVMANAMRIADIIADKQERSN